MSMFFAYSHHPKMRKEGTTKVYVLPLSKRSRRKMKEQGLRVYTTSSALEAQKADMMSAGMYCDRLISRSLWPLVYIFLVQSVVWRYFSLRCSNDVLYRCSRCG